MTPVALILAGGLGLGAYQLGACRALAEVELFEVQAIAGASIGAINGAILAGNAPETRLEALAEFWEAVTSDLPPSAWIDPLGWNRHGMLRHGRNWTSVLSARLGGVPNLFRPRLAGSGGQPTASLYDVAPVRDTLARFIDFDRLNDGPVRLCIATTDVETGESVRFDTAAGDRITIDHLIASGGLLPSFAPLRIDGRLLGDGGFSTNAPLDPFLASDRIGNVPRLCFLLDLFAPDVAVTGGLENVIERSIDLQFACQTLVTLDRLQRERTLAARLEPDGDSTDLVYLRYRASADEAGPEKTFDFSRATIRDRIARGAADAAAAIAMLSSVPRTDAAGLRIHRVRGDARS
ncbi:MAG TPA: patatin-like phospholipase family protein [Sphingomonas sp.]|jgi:NTE family protein|uniref:patatin-like phospholipase family protein n=1 Tax=Sphingomonas sp. TaxID=28214 RepID=UPI002EDA6F8A